jgi:steroid delta-isomerase-like uncharacterized protein
MSEQTKTIARKVFEDVQSQGNLALVDEIVANDFVGHTPPADIHGPEGAKQYDAMLREAFPDMQITVEDQIAEGDEVATRWTCRGTHEGEFQGLPPTGKRVTMSGLTVFRIANGKIVEGWSRPDLLGLLQQLGAVPELEQAR